MCDSNQIHFPPELYLQKRGGKDRKNKEKETKKTELKGKNITSYRTKIISVLTKLP